MLAADHSKSDPALTLVSLLGSFHFLAHEEQSSALGEADLPSLQGRPCGSVSADTWHAFHGPVGVTTSVLLTKMSVFLVAGEGLEPSEVLCAAFAHQVLVPG